MNPELSIDDVRGKAAELAAARDEIVSRAAQLAADADAARVEARRAASVRDAAAFEQASNVVAETHGARRSALGGLTALDTQIADLVAQLAGDPCDLEPDVPLALLPVRLETRYSDDGSTLRVRVYPDDIHVDRLDRGVSDDERAAGIAYWTAIWTGTATEDAAWQTLVTAVHRDRAAWVASSTTPDLSQRPDPPGAVPAPVFPPTQPRQQRPAIARGLPDRFVVAAVQGGAVRTAVGNPVPPELVVGLPPDADPSTLVQKGKVVLGSGMEWLIDPIEAAKVGMLIEVELAFPDAAVDFVAAFGVRSSLDPAASAAEFTKLIDNHRFASGATFVSPGTPTNNTETDRAAWTSHPDPAPPPTRVVASPDAGSNAAVAAHAFGIDSTSLAPLVGAGGTDQPLAAAAHTALWQATWGTFLDRVLVVTADGPSIDDDLRERWRDWWQQYVRGRGPIPSLRVGDQPYGVLPAAAVHAHWQPDGAERFEAALLNLLRNGEGIVGAGVANVPRIDGNDPLDDTLLEILGSAPNLLGLRVRSVATEALVSYTGFYFGLDGTNQASQQMLDAVLWAQLGFPAGTQLNGSLAKTTRPLGLPLVDDSDPEFIARLLADQPRTVQSVLQALLDLSAAREKNAITQSAPDESPRSLLDRGAQVAGDFTQELADLTQVTLQGEVEPVRLHAIADRVAERFGAAGPATLAAQQPIAAVRTNLAADALSPALPSSVSAHLAVSVLGAWFRAQARFAEFQEAARRLAKASTDDRRIVVAEALDCASHRYDAWVSALPAHRLEQLRAGAPSGLLLGAYGWVENLSRGAATTRPGGYIHAPSINHAVTGGVLRSGYLTHNPDAAGSGALAVDLSSARVRRAMELLDGVRQGQPLGALVGYLVERRFHEEGLDRFTLSLRALAPVVARRLTDRADAVPAPAQESIAANNVVDGIRLLGLARAAVHAALVKPPADNPYLPPGSWVPPSPTELLAIDATLDEAAGAYDAVSDLLLAEAVHQLVQGNTARGAAALDAAAGGDAAPVDPDVVRTPTRAIALTQRVIVLLDDTPPGSNGWSPNTPRARAEPRLAAWAEARLPAATDIVVHVDGGGARTTLDAAGLSALDLVFDSADAGLLDRRLRAALPALGADPRPAVRDPAWPPGLLAIAEAAVAAAALLPVIVGAQPLAPTAFARPNDKPVRTVDASELAARLTPLVNELGQAAQDLGGALAANPVDQAAIDAAIDALRAYGISLPSDGADSALAAQASLAETNRRHDAALAAIVAVPFDATAARTTGEAVFGPGFPVLALAVPGAADLYDAAFGLLDPGRSRLRRWLRDVATVRPAVARYAATLLFADALGGVGAGPRLTVAQLAASGTPGTDAWLGLPLPDGAPSPDQPVTDVFVEAPAGYAANDTVAGFVVDEWVEQMPRRNADGGATVTTGVALNAFAPNARAPQAVLLAVSPDGNRWTTGALLDLCTETLQLAKQRAVTLERTTLIGRILPALQAQSWSLQGEETLDIKFLATEIASVLQMMPYVAETTP
ncbi:MAG: hypothetical protein JWL83_2821 [Actinomycetia bacterium]|nr:hypothetical protein [Actinomycetes bacterium]